MKRIIVICTLLLATFAVPVFAQTILQPVLVTTWIAPINTGFPALVIDTVPVPNGHCPAVAPACAQVYKFLPNVATQWVPYFPNRAAAQASGIASNYPIAVPVGQ